MTRPFNVLAVALMAVSDSGSEPPIRYVPRVVDAGLASRYHLCPDAPASGGANVANDARRSVAELLGPELVEVQVHQVGDGFRDFGAVEAHLRALLARRPRVASRDTPWAEGTPLAAGGILGTLRYPGGREGRIEVAGVHVCAQDSAGTFWWMRLAHVDVWP